MSFYTGWPLCGRFFLTKFTSVKGSLDTKADVSIGLPNDKWSDKLIINISNVNDGNGGLFDCLIWLKPINSKCHQKFDEVNNNTSN